MHFRDRDFLYLIKTTIVLFGMTSIVTNGIDRFLHYYHERTKTNAVGERVQGRSTLFPKFKKWQYYFSKTSILLVSYSCAFEGRQGCLQKEYILYARENDEKNGRHLN